MKDKLQQFKAKTSEFWQKQTKKQRVILLSSVVGVILFLAFLIYFTTKTTYEELYSNLPLQETGQIKATLDERGVPSVISKDGSTILVPKSQVDALKVDLAHEGIPNSGTINYKFFEEQAGLGMTDKEFGVLERAAMQTELANLIRNIDGVNQANVMITLPEPSVWLNSEAEEAQAAIILTLANGRQLDQSQVKALYHLVSRSIPNLPIDNIDIIDQNFNDYAYKNEDEAEMTLSTYEQQRAIQQDIERDLTKNIQQMLGTLIGRDKVLVSVTTDIDFTKENRTEALVEPVDVENNEGIAISIEKIEETFSGEGTVEGGIPGTGEEIPNYNTSVGQDGPTEWERNEERINNEVNRINREIVESPYAVRDLSIQVMVEAGEEEDALQTQERLDSIEQLLAAIVRTSISKEYTDDWTEEDLVSRIAVSAHTFSGKESIDDAFMTVIPVWMYIVGAVLLLIIILLIVMLVRRRREEDEFEDEFVEQESDILPDLPDEDSSVNAMKRKQLEKLAEEKPEEFSKLLRTWLSED